MVTMNDEHKLLHWYGFVFQWVDGVNILTRTENLGFEFKDKLGWQSLNDAREAANAPETALILNIYYLGQMTTNEFNELE